MRTAFVNDVDAVREGLLRSLAGADVVVSHPTLCSVIEPVATHLGVPVVVGHLFPMMVPTQRWTPPIGSRSPDLGRRTNRALWSIVTTGTTRWLYDKQFNELRASFGLESNRANSLVAWTGAARTVMLLSPYYYGAAADDWPPMTWAGFSTWTGPSGMDVDPAVDAFVNDGDPPVLVTLGTSAATGAGERFATIGRGLDALGLRSLHLVGDARNLASLAGRPGAFEFAPITHVLLRCRVAVVSGALGALSTALQFGVPVVVVPQLFDQLWHGRRVEQLGVGVMAHSASAVVKAVARIDADPEFRRRARELATKMAGEDAARVMADVVESVVS
jgi:UDP:flavonoid glycosyltransferase YjiC (YdhE family)